MEVLAAGRLGLSLHWRGGLIAELRVQWAKDIAATESLSDHGRLLADALSRYVEGERVMWPDLPLDFSPLSDFQRNVLEALRTIPHGQVRTYGELAEMVGRPGGAQAVGQVMGSNPFPVVYPCHRVVGADGSMTGFSAEGGVALKRFLLQLEGAFTGQLSLFD